MDHSYPNIWRKPGLRHVHRAVTCLLAAACFPEPSLAEVEPPLLEYHVRVQPQTDRTMLDVRLRFQAGSTEPVRIGLPRDCYGSSELHTAVEEFEGLDGSLVSDRLQGDQRTVTPNKDGMVSLSYRLNFDPGKYQALPFGPSSGRDFLHVAGCQWLLRIGDPDQPSSYQVKLATDRRGWQLYTSLAPDPSSATVTASYNQMLTTAIGGGAGFHRRLLVQGQPIDVFIDNSLDDPAGLGGYLENIVISQRKRFSDFDYPFYVISLRPRPDVIAGTRIENLFVAFVRPDAEILDVKLLLAHELFHDLIPGRIGLVQPDGEPNLRRLWFTEGFTDYAARLLLLEAGLLSKSDFIDTLNLDTLRVAYSPVGDLNYAGIREAASAGRFSNHHQKLLYFRGARLALDWDLQIRSHSSGHETLLNFLTSALSRARAEDGRIEEQALLALAAQHGVDAGPSFTSYILDGALVGPVVPPASTGLVLGTRHVPSFDLGFDPVRSARSGQIQGVIEGGPAHRAGLRDGMVLVAMKNVSVSINGWKPDRPVEIRIRSDGREHSVAFMPSGTPISLPWFMASEEADR